MKSAYFETSDEVKKNIKAILYKEEGEEFRKKIAFDGTDVSKFKDSIDLNIFMKMLSWLTEGFISKVSIDTIDELKIYCKEFEECMNLLKKNFYKDEYL